MMKKLICVVLALGLLLAGCGGGGSGGGKGITSVVHPDFALSGGFIEPVDQVKSAPEGYIAITTAEEFDKIRLNSAASYILMNDIDLSGLEWEHISTFSGILDGNGYTVSGASEELIWSLEGGILRNLGVYGELTNCAAGIACQAIDGSTVQNCWFDGSIRSEATIEAVLTVMSVGGISVYAEDSSFISCYNAADINAAMNQCGGVVSEIYENTTVKNCFNTGNITLTSDLYLDVVAGGVVGLMSINTGDGSQCQVVNCYNSGNVTGKTAAGIVGSVEITEMYVTLNIDRCFNIGNISGSDNEGGIANLLLIEEGSLVVTNCYNACTDALEAGIVGGPVLQRAWDLPSEDVMNAYIAYCYNIAPADAGIAEACKNLEYCYFLDNAPSATADGAMFASVEQLTSDDMKSKNSFEGFDFENIWKISRGEYPYPVFSNTTY